ncbi:hypothetical protein RIF29_14125 [Crotalaria pallida]|uniref:Uncharacterized protein n=1 Tax=Crotalaria pallida TaxID=3830 RepID=A0AAN9FCS3_CROPI
MISMVSFTISWSLCTANAWWIEIKGDKVFTYEEVSCESLCTYASPHIASSLLGGMPFLLAFLLCIMSTNECKSKFYGSADSYCDEGCANFPSFSNVEIEGSDSSVPNMGFSMKDTDGEVLTVSAKMRKGESNGSDLSRSLPVPGKSFDSVLRNQPEWQDAWLLASQGSTLFGSRGKHYLAVTLLLW